MVLRAVSGHLLNSGGHLVANDDCCCNSCSSTYTAVVSGFTGTCASNIENTYNLSYINDTLWESGSDYDYQQIYKMGDTWYFKINVGLGQYYAIATLSDDGGCPATGTYSLVGSGTCGGQTGQVVIS